MSTDDEIRDMIREFKQQPENANVDWDVFEAYAIVNENTKEVERMGVVRKDRMMSFYGGEM